MLGSWLRKWSLEMNQSPRNWQLLALMVLSLWPLHVSAWTDDQLLIWMDSQQAQGLRPITAKFKHDWGIEVTIDTPGKHTQ
jgi:maltose-binding protein MalE